VRNWKFFDFVATGSTYDFSRYELGAQAEVQWLLNGLGAYAGPLVTTRGDAGGTVGVGWSVFYLEGRAQFEERARVVLAGGVRVPLGLIAYALWRPQFRAASAPMRAAALF
jgi:hypothetical protein